MFDALARQYSSWRRYHNTAGALMKLSNRELDDLGIHASEIPFIAREAANMVR